MITRGHTPDARKLSAEECPSSSRRMTGIALATSALLAAAPARAHHAFATEFDGANLARSCRGDGHARQQGGREDPWRRERGRSPGSRRAVADRRGHQPSAGIPGSGLRAVAPKADELWRVAARPHSIDPVRRHSADHPAAHRRPRRLLRRSGGDRADRGRERCVGRAGARRDRRHHQLHLTHPAQGRHAAHGRFQAVDPGPRR